MYVSLHSEDISSCCDVILFDSDVEFFLGLNSNDAAGWYVLYMYR